MAINEEYKEALREFFQHERDKELGRWRWPDNPDYVVYAKDTGDWLVLNESTGHTKHYTHREHANVGGSNMTKAARAYFEAHPERKPWHDAKPGEVWELTLDDESEHIVFVHADRTVGGRDGVSAGGAYFDIDDATGIVSGRRLWPESA
ncbi:hypothetical protein AB0300_18830 [Microbacterium sp. NPDC078814]|uniref:hypothetical protein n=1 Tax=Microbacterium sp. NPDC078814 TaxID=3154767 RepID=UPI00344B75D8